jgi:membrane-associated phospholipid phosphatase
MPDAESVDQLLNAAASVQPREEGNAGASLVRAVLAEHAGFQQVLWDNYQGHLDSTIAGTAAFPSLHVAVPAHLALATRPGWWRRSAWLLTLVTWFCSVILGWHYLVDGEGGILVAAGAWMGAGLIPKVRSCR